MARVVVGISSSLGSLAAFHRAVDEAYRRGVEVLAVLAWQPPGGEHGYRAPMAAPAHRRPSRSRRSAAHGPTTPSARPARVSAHAELIRADPGAALAALADRPDDLLVVGAGSGNWLCRGTRLAVLSRGS
ncbi:universal stress protein [Kitasatospora sp. DSM 101779]|nr:universal stress protein [Kitasatospora sp. DSM 101779]